MLLPAVPTLPHEGGAPNRLAPWLAGLLLLAAVAIPLGFGPARSVAGAAGAGCGGTAAAYAVMAAPDAPVAQRASRARTCVDASGTAACADPALPRVADGPQVARAPAGTVYPVRSEIVPRPVESRSPQRPPRAA